MQIKKKLCEHFLVSFSSVNLICRFQARQLYFKTHIVYFRLMHKYFNTKPQKRIFEEFSKAPLLLQQHNTQWLLVKQIKRPDLMKFERSLNYIETVQPCIFHGWLNFELQNANVLFQPLFDEPDICGGLIGLIKILNFDLGFKPVIEPAVGSSATSFQLI